MLSTKLFGLQFKNPIIAASTDISRSLASYEALLRSGVGGIVTKSVTDAATLQATDLARFFACDSDQHAVCGELPSSYTLLSRGGAMMSIDELAQKAPVWIEHGSQAGTVVIGSISAADPDNWLAYARQMEALGFHALELNFGNPHGEASVKKLGYLIGQTSDLCRQICKSVSAAVNIPVIAKLTPQVSDLAGMVVSLEDSGIAGVTIMHRYQGLILSETDDRPLLAGRAAIGGPWMKPITLANLSKVAQASKLPIIGGNGADTARDVYEYMLCGASLVEVGSSLMLRGPAWAGTLIAGLQEIMEQKNVSSVNDLTGRALKDLTSYRNLDQLPKVRPSAEKSLCAECTELTCVDRCYFDALIPTEESTIRFDKDKCSGCGLCAQVCPHQAVTMS